MFRGEFQHAVDAKGRTSLPAKFRELLSAKGEEQLIITAGPNRSLWCLPPSAWRELEEKVRKLPQFDPKVQTFMHAFIAPAQDCSFDKLGRVLIPPPLRAHAGLEGDVTWAGMIDRIELWSHARWMKRKEETAPVLDGAGFSDIGNLGL